MPELSIADVVAFVLKYRRGKCFMDWQSYQIALEVQFAINENTFGYVRYPDGQLKAIAIGTIVDEAKRTIRIKQLLTDGSKHAISDLLEIFQRLYRGWDIVGRRNGKTHYFSSNKFQRFSQLVKQLT